jgi:hypothetical protein
MLLDKDRLHALGREFEPSWATGTGLRAMQAPPRAAPGEKPRADEKRPPATETAE